MPGHQDRGSGRIRSIERKVGTRLAVRVQTPISKEIRAEPITLDRFQKARRNDLVGIHIRGWDYHARRGKRSERLHLTGRHERVRTSAMAPVTAVAAAVSGLARNVRPPFPCRPSKLRLLVLTAL